jgi:hypothetical protein
VRALLLAMIASACTVGRGPDPVTARPPPDPDRMPSDVLDKQDPGADTSSHPTLSRSEANPHPWLSDLFGGCGNATRSSGRETFIGCGGCETRDVSGASNLALVAVAALVVTRRRKRSSRRRNAPETRRVARSTHV